MPAPRSPDVDRRSDERKKAEKIYLEGKGNVKLVEIAEQIEPQIIKYESGSPWMVGRANCTLLPIKMAKKTGGAFH